MTCSVKKYVPPRDMAEAYHSAVTRIKEIHGELERINSEMSQAFDGKDFGFAMQSSGYSRGIGALLRNTKRKAWETILAKMGVEAYMSVAERQKFRDAIGHESKWEEDPGDPVHELPDITPENIEAVFRGYAASLDQMLEEKAQEVYHFLKPYENDEHKTNIQNRWKIGGKAILEYGVSLGYGKRPFRASDSKDAKLHSMDVLFHLLDGKGIPRSHRGPLHEAIYTIEKSGQAVETDYFRLKAFKNRKLHIEFKRLDLVQDINLMCGNRSELPDQRKDAKYQGQSRECDTSRFDGLDLNFFETPSPVIERLIDAVALRGGDRVLEPSAGSGAIANAAFAITGVPVFAFELDSCRSQMLHSQGHRTEQSDFLLVTPRPEFDAVMMNPPFSHQRDIAHIEHAIRFLAPGGRLAAVASAGVLFRGDKRSVGFRETIARMGGAITMLPDGSFSDSGTEVNTVLVAVSRE